jgi:hypothetical protein
MSTPFVQSKAAGFATGSATRTLAFDVDVTAGSLLVATIAMFGAATDETEVTDSLGQHWTKAGGYVRNGSQSISLWFFPNTAAGACTVSSNPAGASAPRQVIGIHEYSGVAVANALWATATATGASTTPSAGALTAKTAGDLIVTGFGEGNQNLSSITVDAPFTLRSDVETGVGTDALGSADDESATGAAQTATFTLDLSSTWAAIAATFRAAYFDPIPPLRFLAGVPIRGVPWARPFRDPWPSRAVEPPATPPSPNSFPHVLSGGPPIRGVPWVKRIPGVPLLREPPPPGPTPWPHLPGLQFVPIQGVPWNRFLSFPPPPRVAAGRVVVPNSPGVGKARPFVPRVPSKEDLRRLPRFTEIVADFANSLMLKGILIQEGSADWSLVIDGGEEG